MADEQTFLNSLLSGAKKIGTNLMNIPTNINKSYQAGNLFGTGGSLGGLLSPEARQEAQRQAIMKLGLGLLGQGPSRTPISFGQSLASGLLGAQDQFGKEIRSELEGELTAQKISDTKRKQEALDVISNSESTAKEIDKAILILDPVEYYKLKNKDLSPSDLEAEYLENLKNSNPSEYNKIMKKRAERSGSSLFDFPGINYEADPEKISDQDLADQIRLLQREYAKRQNGSK